MTLTEAVSAYTSVLQLQGGNEHQEQAQIILTRAAAWLARKQPHLTPEFVPVAQLEQLTTRHVTEYLCYRKTCPGLKPGTTLSAATLAKEARYLRAFLNHVAADPVTYRLPLGWATPSVSKIRQPKLIPQALEETSLDRVFDSCQYATLPDLPNVNPREWWFTLLYVAYVTALRRRALFALVRPTDWQLDQHWLFLPASANKSGEDKLCPLTTLAVRLVKQLPCKAGQPMFVWKNRHGSDDYRGFYHHLKQIQDKAGIPPNEQTRLHTLRKTSLTYMARQGVGMSIVQQHAGHSDPSITARFYLGTMSVPQAEAVRQLPTPETLQKLCE